MKNKSIREGKKATKNDTKSKKGLYKAKRK